MRGITLVLCRRLAPVLLVAGAALFCVGLSGCGESASTGPVKTLEPDPGDAERQKKMEEYMKTHPQGEAGPVKKK